jgi:hypothetical protein
MTTQNPYSGPASSYSTIGNCEAAYWRMVNDTGGINGRTINFISLETATVRPRRWRLSANSSKRTTSSAASTPSNQYSGPQILRSEEGAATLRRHRRLEVGRPKHFPWTMGFQPDYRTEAIIYAKHILAYVTARRWTRRSLWRFTVGQCDLRIDAGGAHSGGTHILTSANISNGGQLARNPMRRSSSVPTPVVGICTPLGAVR